MSVFYCVICRNSRDGDEGVHEWDGGLICEDCHAVNTPEDWNDWVLTPRVKGWQLTHREYKGASAADRRCFTAETIDGAWRQVIEYEANQ